MGTRTPDLRITSAPLYRLSYIGLPSALMHQRFLIIADKSISVTRFLKKIWLSFIDMHVPSLAPGAHLPACTADLPQIRRLACDDRFGHRPFFH